MPIELANPVTQPARTFDKLWVLASHIRSEPGGATSGGYVAAPYTDAGGELAVSPERTARQMPDLYALAAQRYAAGKPALAQWLQLGQDVVAELEAEAATGADPFNVSLPE